VPRDDARVLADSEETAGYAGGANGAESAAHTPPERQKLAAARLGRSNEAAVSRSAVEPVLTGSATD
jgi:hypothetical protein